MPYFFNIMLKNFSQNWMPAMEPVYFQFGIIVNSLKIISFCSWEKLNETMKEILGKPFLISSSPLDFDKED